MNAKSWHARTRRDLIIEVWEALDCESVGAHELEQIQHALGEKFGAGALESPAAIARVVADEGATLRHPEVFEFDVKWRRQQMAKTSFGEELDFSSLSSAFASVVKLEERRLQQIRSQKSEVRDQKSEVRSHEQAISQELGAAVVAARGDCLLRARSKILDRRQQEQAKEISEWLRVWLQSPELFSDWLDLRRRSPEYRAKFPEDRED